ncbi:MAG: M48 family metalloprotease [Hyphomicrobiales bacterium]|nr:M48 family metalloprotease [Hyphomicrobiales bacterium]MBV8664804.1 M48 family metalloprotease [Hyphomicrobiales bacterium]
MDGLIGLLVMCAQAAGDSAAAEQSLANIRAKLRSTDFQPAAVLRTFGATPLPCADAPELYAILLGVCARAGMQRVPELFLLPAPGMNAYALGRPDNACISVTDGLLRGLSRDEVAGILAHEVAHILGGDTCALRWASAIEGEIAALSGFAEVAARQDPASDLQALLLAAAPAVARLLFFALSRIRELAADAKAIDLIDHPSALVAALCKLEYFHTGRTPLHAHLQDGAFSGTLRSHPGTWERIANLA